MSDSVGKISLDLELQSDLSKQIGEAANKVGEQLKASLKNIGNLDFKGLANTLSNTLKKSIDDSMKSVQTSIEKTLKSAISGATASTKNIKIPVDFGIPKNSPLPNLSTSSSATTPRAPPIPKVNTGINMDALKAQIDNLTQSLDITNRRIEQQQEKLAGLKETYTNTFNEARKNKLQEQILQTEATINRLTATSDKAGFKLADLDAQFETLGNAAKNATVGVKTIDENLKKASNSSKNAASGMKLFGNSAKNSTGKATSGISMMGRMLDRMIVRMFLFNTVMKALGAIARFTSNAFMANTQFANSLLQIKTNLQVAFMPIYQAVLPAINALMGVLSRITAYIAVFTSALFGKTYQASYGAAKNLNASVASMKDMEKQSKKTAGALASFDEINALSKGGDNASTGAGGVSAPEMAMPSIDISPTSAVTKSIEDMAAKTKAVLATIFLPFKIGWDTYGASIVSNIEGTVSNIIHIFKGIGTTISDVWGSRGQGVVNTFYGLLQTGSMVLNVVSKYMKDVWDNGGQYAFEKILGFGASVIELAGKINERFVQPLIKWFADNIEPKLSNAVGGVNKVIGDLFDKLTQFIDWLGGDGKGTLDTIIIVLGSMAVAWGLVTLYMNAGSIATGIWNIVAGIGTGITTAFGAAVAFLTSPITLVILAIGALIAIGVLLYKHWDEVSKFLSDTWQWIKDTAVNVWNGIAKFFSDIWIGIKNTTTSVFNSILGFFKEWGPLILAIITGPIGQMVYVVVKHWDTIKSATMKAFQGIKDFIGGVCDSVAGFFKGMVNGVISGMNFMIRGLNKIQIPKIHVPLVGDVGGIGFNIREIPYLAKGGVINQPTLAMVGEAGKEAVVPLENNTQGLDLLAEKLSKRGGFSNGDGEVTFIIQNIVDGDVVTEKVIKNIQRKNRMSGKTVITT